MAETFTAEERGLLARYFTDLNGDVFALTGLPEVVKGALFARYSRSSKSLRRLFLEEFAPGLTGDEEFAPELPGDDAPAAATSEQGIGVERAQRLYERVLTEYGDDSVAQLGGAHVAVEGASNLLTKQLERGRLAAYLEQSTRYVAYDDKPGGRYRYHRDPDVLSGRHAAAYIEHLDAIFDTYAALLPQVLDWVRTRYPATDAASERAWRSATKAKALDVLRGLLPAATTSNVGIFASGQAYEALLLRLHASELAEAGTCYAALLRELRKVIPSFLTRIDRPARGGAWSAYLRATRADTRTLADHVLGEVAPAPVEEVTLVDWSPRDPGAAEVQLVAAMLYPHANLPEEQLLGVARSMGADERRQVIDAYVGERRNRRHKPGRAFERLWYRFDVLGDYGAFRDLQRHRMLTIDWQDLTTRHGYETPREIEEAGVADRWHQALERSAALYEQLLADHPAQAQYAVCFAYRTRYVMQLNARAAMHLIELRSSPQGHPSYRRVVQQMHRLIADVAGHTAVADAMVHVDHGSAELERLDAERRADVRRQQRNVGAGSPSR
ncbi:MAG: FAD-dependent thymidylate synthase [Actinomycetota bacterium]|nr:FAD-dependent thymidylate synthase [Actinomycetota bacterium]